MDTTAKSCLADQFPPVSSTVVRLLSPVIAAFNLKVDTLGRCVTYRRLQDERDGFYRSCVFICFDLTDKNRAFLRESEGGMDFKFKFHNDCIVQTSEIRKGLNGTVYMMDNFDHITIKRGVEIAQGIFLGKDSNGRPTSVYFMTEMSPAEMKSHRHLFPDPPLDSRLEQRMEGITYDDSMSAASGDALLNAEIKCFMKAVLSV